MTLDGMVSDTSRLCAVRRTRPFTRAGVSGALRRANTAVRKGSDSDVIYYLNT